MTPQCPSGPGAMPILGRGNRWSALMIMVLWCTIQQLQILFWHDRSKWTAYDDGHNIIMQTVNDKAQNRRIIVIRVTVFRCVRSYSVHSSDVVLAAAANWQDDTATVTRPPVYYLACVSNVKDPRETFRWKKLLTTRCINHQGGKVSANSYRFYYSNASTNVCVIC